MTCANGIWWSCLRVKCIVLMRYEYREHMFSTQPKLFGGCSMSKLFQNSGTGIPQLMNTSGFHQNGRPLSFGKGSGCARLVPAPAD